MGTRAVLLDRTRSLTRAVPWFSRTTDRHARRHGLETITHTLGPPDPALCRRPVQDLFPAPNHGQDPADRGQYHEDRHDGSAENRPADRAQD